MMSFRTYSDTVFAYILALHCFRMSQRKRVRGVPNDPFRARPAACRGQSRPENGRVELRGFGAFSTRARDARTGRNPRTGELVEVDAKRVPYFKPGKEMRQRLNVA